MRVSQLERERGGERERGREGERGRERERERESSMTYPFCDYLIDN